MSQINIQELTFAYEGSYDNIFEKASFSIDTDWKLGFIGRNGKGKTTFLNLLMKKFSYEGSISSSIEFEYFPYPITDENRLAIDVISEIHPDYLHWQLVREMNLLEISDELLYRNFNTLSGGEKTKLLLATLFLKENNFLLIDEPTNHLDQTGREIVSRYLNSKKGFILISHDRSFLDGCIDHILSINRSSIEVQKGNFSSWLINKRNRDELELSENRKLLGDIKRFEQSAREKSNWSDMIEKQKTGGAPCDRGYLGHQSARMMKRAKNMEKRQQKAIEEKSKLLKDLDRSFPLKIEQMKFHSRIYTAVNDLCIFYNNKSIFEQVSLCIEQGDRIALRGKNGSGKSSILKLICGEKIEYTGEFVQKNQLKISYVSQETAHLQGNLSSYAREYAIDESLFKAILQKLDFDKKQFDKEMQSFSEGQKKKVLIARSLCEPSHLLVWDEPLNYIDIISRMQIENLLLDFEPTILFVEHDKAFCDKIATKTVDLN